MAPVLLASLVFTLWAATSGAQGATPGYPERVIQWKVEGDESCADIAEAVYGSATHAPLVTRYNAVPCRAGTPLKPGMVLILPAKATKLPAARVTFVNPDTLSKHPGTSWGKAEVGQALEQHAQLNTRDQGLAALQFADSSKIFLDEHTLVVIYDTAQNSVRQKAVPQVLLKEGELQAGLFALRGRTVEVEMDGDARVSADSSDTVVRRRDGKANVSVFDGSARVKSGGATVAVPKNHGTTFRAQKPPAPPRPLPPAPSWKGDNHFVFLAGSSGGTLLASWKKVDVAESYRVEISRTPEFDDLVVRELVPSDVLSFRAEQFPVGRYFARVRAIDADDFLGISSSTRKLVVLGVHFERGHGKVSASGIDSSKYSEVLFSGAPGVLVGLDEERQVPLPLKVSFARDDVEGIWVKLTGGSSVAHFPVVLGPVEADLSLESSGKGLLAQGQINAPGHDISRDIRPQLRIVQSGGGRIEPVPVVVSADGRFRAELQVPLDQGARVQLQDLRGRLLASQEYVPEVVIEPPAEPEPGFSTFWLRAQSHRLASRVAVPRATKQATLGASFDFRDSEPRARWDVHASGNVGEFSIDALVELADAPAERGLGKVGSLGVAYRMLRHDDFSLAPVLRAYLPLSDDAPLSRVEVQLAIAGRRDLFTWAGSAGLRGRLLEKDHDRGRAFTDAATGLLQGSLLYQFIPLVAGYAELDFAVLTNQGSPALPRGGVGLGAALGRIWVLNLGGRIAPFADVGEGHFSAQLGLGVRTR